MGRDNDNIEIEERTCLHCATAIIKIPVRDYNNERERHIQQWKMKWVHKRTGQKLCAKVEAEPAYQ